MIEYQYKKIQTVKENQREILIVEEYQTPED